MSRLYLVRHGQTDWNLERRYQGSIDIPLNETGKQEARSVSQKLKEIPFVAAYASPLSRAQETAQLILEGRPLEIQTHSSLVELSFGPLEGKIVHDVHAEYPDRVSLRQSLKNQEQLAFKIVPGVESGTEAVQRVLPALLDIAQAHIDQDVLIVTHGGIIHSLLVHIEDHDWSSFRIQNGEVVIFDYHQGSLQLSDDFFNHRDHRAHREKRGAQTS